MGLEDNPVFGKMFKAAKNLAVAPTGNTQTSMGAELGEARSQMTRAIESELSPTDSRPKANYTPTRERLTLGSFKKGTDRVPKTGVYKLHEGEAVIPAEKNPMNAADAMAGISGKETKPPKKIKEIRSKKTHDGKIVHTHVHHHPMHHDEETYVSNDGAAAAQHMTDQEPNMSAAPPEMPEAAPSAGPAGQ
jgi:hypothetical protein